MVEGIKAKWPVKIFSFLAFFILLSSFPNPLFAQLDEPVDKPLIAKPNPALRGIKELSLAIVFSEPNAEGLDAGRLKDKAVNQLNDAGFTVDRSSLGHILKVPQLTVDIGVLNLESCGQYAIFVKTALERGLAMPDAERIHIAAEVWKAESGLLSVSSDKMPDEVNAVVQQQVQAFISACSVADAADKQPDANRMEPRSSRANARRDAKPEKRQNVELKYVGSKNSQVFHKPDCPSAKKILPENLVTYSSREDAISADKRPCQRCNP